MPKLGPGLFRFFLAFVVVFHHSTPLRLGAWAVGLFFCLSGYWIAEMWARKYSLLDRPYPDFLISRWWRLAPVLFFTSFLAGCLMYGRVIAGDVRVVSKVGWWCTQPLIAGSTRFGWILPPSWSLDVEMQFYILAPVLAVLLVRLPRSARLVLLLIALTWCWIKVTRGEAGESARLDIWLGVFLLGMVASVSRWRPTFRLACAAAIISVVIFVVTAVIPATRSWILVRGSTGHVLVSRLAATLTLGTIILSTPLAIWTTGLASTRFDRFLGDLSYPLYLFHWLPRSWYYSHVTSSSRPSQLLMPLAINMLASLVGAIVIQFIIDRPIQQLRARWVKWHRFMDSASQASKATASTKPAASEFAGTA